MSAVEVYQGGIGESIVVFGNLAGQIAKTEFVPDAFRNRPEAVLACMLFGQECGLPPMASLNLTQSIKGKVGLKPEGMRAVVQAHGHRIWTEEYGDDRVILCGQRQGEDHVARVTWTMKDAERAELTKTNPTWKKYPRAMLLARATSELCRLHFSDVTGGIAYGPDELEEIASSRPTERVSVVGADTSGRDAVGDPPPPGPSPVRQQHVEHTRTPSMAQVVDTAELPPSTGARKRRAPTGAGGVGVAPEAPPRSEPAPAELVAQVTDVIDALKEAGDEWAERGREAWKAAGLPSTGAGRLSKRDAEVAFDVLAAVLRDVPAEVPSTGGAPS